MSCLILHWKFQFIYSALNLMFLLDFSLHFFKVNASTKLDFFKCTISYFGGGMGRKRIQPNANLHILHLGFLGLGFPLWPSVYVLQAPGPAAASICHPPPFPFMSRSTFVISQLEQHDLELFKAACTFCIKKYEKERKKSKETKGYLIMYVSST